MSERRRLDERESARVTDQGDAGSIEGAGDPATDREAGAEATREIAPGGGNTVGAGRGSADLGKVGGIDAGTEDIGGSEAGLGGGSGDPGGGGLGDDLGTLPDEAGDSGPLDDEGQAGASRRE